MCPSIQIHILKSCPENYDLAPLYILGFLRFDFLSRARAFRVFFTQDFLLSHNSLPGDKTKSTAAEVAKLKQKLSHNYSQLDSNVAKKTVILFTAGICHFLFPFHIVYYPIKRD